MSIVDEILDRREVHELIMEIRDELTARKLYRKEYLQKMDEIIFYLNCISKQTKRKRRKIIHGKRCTPNTKPKMAINNK